jgi:cell shape-determining protein MreC
MAPINQQERRKAFLNFLLFFTLTMGIIITTLLFSFQVPFKENEMLRQKMAQVENEKVVLRSFEIKLHETMDLLDSVNLSGYAYRVDNLISRNIMDMTQMSSDSSVSVKSMLNIIIDNLKNLQVAKEQIRSENASAAELEKRDREIEQLKGMVKQYEAILLQQARK